MKLKLFFCLFLVQFVFSQHRTCGMEQHMQKLMADPVERQNYLDTQARFQLELNNINNNPNRIANPTTTIRVPVAVHFPKTLGTATAALKTCLRNLAQTQVDILNADYNGTNSDISQWAGVSGLYPGTNTSGLNIEFVIATQNHPVGTGLVNGDKAITFGTDFLGAGDRFCTNGCNRDITWAGYCNLVVVNIAGGVLGFSPLGGSPSQGMTVVIDDNAFAKTMTTSPTSCTGYVPAAPYNKGRTLTHELGHFFNLNHTFISADDTATNCAPNDADGIADTPKCPAAAYGCPSDGAVGGCDALPSLTMNFMDYTDDACMYMFTGGQASRMQAWYNTIAPSLTTNTLASSEFLSNNFSILPNPNNGTFILNLKETLDNYTVEIFDATGRIIYEKQYNQNQDLQQNISIDQSQKGIYFINIKSENAILTKKIIVN